MREVGMCQGTLGQLAGWVALNRKHGSHTKR